MKKVFRSRTVFFLCTQTAILLGIMAAFLALSCVLFVRNATQWRLHNLEEDLKVFAMQAVRSGEIPKRGDLGSYTFFILGVDGKFILPRLPRMDESERIWEEHEAKLRYEMQKRRDGWSYYPDNPSSDMRTGQYVLRYVYMESMGWIVGVEAYIPGPLVLLEGILTPTMFLGAGVITLAAFIFMLFNAHWHFTQLTRAVYRSQDNNFIESEAEVVPRRSVPGGKSEDRLPVSMPASERESLSGPAQVQFRPPPEKPLPDYSVAYTAPAPAPRLEAKTPKPVAPARPGYDQRRLDDLGSVTIETNDIRSPILKKAIEELRDSRK